MPTSIEPITKFKEYTSFGADIDLIAEGPSFPPQPKLPARYLKVIVGSGTVAVTMAGANEASPGTDQSASLTMAAGDFEIGVFRKILATGTSGMTRIRVGW